MSTQTWTYGNRAEAEVQYRELVSQGCKAKMWLAYSGEGWRVAVMGV